MHFTRHFTFTSSRSTFPDVPPVAEPFGPAVADVALENPPLVKVLTQVRFPEVTSIVQPEFIGPFQEALRERYPVLRRVQEVGLLVTPQGPAPSPQGGVIWRFTDRSGEWTVSLAPTFVALDTSRYSGHGAFIERLREVLTALGQLRAPLVFDRFGVRYINRLPADDIAALRELVRTEALGFAGSDELPREVTVSHSIHETLFAIEGEGQLQARWGVLPAEVSLDATIDPAPVRSWFLDVDVFKAGPADYDVEQLVALADAYHARAYRFFRWAVMDSLLIQRGGRL